MPFIINFVPLSDSPSNSDLGGGGEFYHLKPVSPYVPGPVYTNVLNVSLRSLTPASEIWVMEETSQGGLHPVIQLTNQVDEGDYGFITGQFLFLTTNQIHSLIAGNWYVAVDFGDSNYLGQLAPQYGFANGPTADARVPLIGGPTPPRYYLAISPNNQNAKVILDASPSTDPYDLPMEYAWTGWAGFATDGPTNFTATGVLSTNIIPLGTYTVRLQVNDDIADGWPYYFSLTVETPAQAVDDLRTGLLNSTLPDYQKNVLSRVLVTAMSQFDQGHMIRGCDQLRRFMGLVKSHKLDLSATLFYSGRVQFILDAFQKR
jgi:hypothetical protein